MSVPAVALPADQPAEKKDGPALQDHMLGTYHGLRLGVCIVGALLPWLLWFGGLWRGVGELLDSMSAYYHTPMRDVFVGVLVAIGFLLYVYKGFSDRENWALNAAGFLAVGVAMFPTVKTGETRDTIGWLHVICAVAFFLCIAYVSIRRAPDTLSLIKDPDIRKRYKWMYRLTGWAMVVSPLTALGMASIGGLTSYVFFVELAGVTAFAAFWLVKSFEMKLTNADELAAEGVLKTAAVKPKDTSEGRIVVTEEALWPEEIAQAETEVRKK